MIFQRFSPPALCGAKYNPLAQRITPSGVPQIGLDCELDRVIAETATFRFVKDLESTISNEAGNGGSTDWNSGWAFG
jgi:hypothetical protein